MGLRTNPRSLRLGVVSDLHFRTAGSLDLAYHNAFDVPGVLERLRTALGWFEASSVDAVVLAGDLTDAGDAQSMAMVLETAADAFGGQILAVPGNHDVLEAEGALARAVLELGEPRLSVLEPAGVVVGGVRVAGLGTQHAQAALVAGWGFAEPLLLVSHFPVFSRAQAFAERGFKYPGDAPDRQHLAELLVGRSGATAIVHGHLHARDTHIVSRVVQLGVAALVEPPFEATIIELVVESSQVTLQRHARAFGDSDALMSPTFVPAQERHAILDEGPTRD